MSDWYGAAREEDGRTDEEVLAGLRYAADADAARPTAERAPLEVTSGFVQATDLRLIDADRVLTDIAAEWLRARAKFGDQQELSWTEWLAVLAEEFGEAAMEVCKGAVRPFEHRPPALLRAELVQVAAVAARFISAMDAWAKGRPATLCRYPWCFREVLKAADEDVEVGHVVRYVRREPDRRRAEKLLA